MIVWLSLLSLLTAVILAFCIWKSADPNHVWGKFLSELTPEDHDYLKVRLSYAEIVFFQSKTAKMEWAEYQRVRVKDVMKDYYPDAIKRGF